MGRDFVRWQELGFSDEEAGELAELRLSDDSFTFGRELALWVRWVEELEGGQRSVPEDLDAAWAARDSVDASLELLSAQQCERVLPFLDDLDRRFRTGTVGMPDGVDLPSALAWRRPRSPGSWWHGRIPLANDQRLYLFDDRSQ